MKSAWLVVLCLKVVFLASATTISALAVNTTVTPRILAEANATGQIQASYGYNSQRDNGVAPLYARVPAKDSAGNATGDYRYTYYHNDHLGTPQRISDKAGNLLWSAQYDAYGKAAVQTTASAQLAVSNQHRFPGQQVDLETGVHYNVRRYYDPETGRYITRDPIGFEGGLNHFAYAEVDPINLTDPTGEVAPLVAYGLRCLGGVALDIVVQYAKNGGNWNCVDLGDAVLSGVASIGIGGRIGYMVSVAQIPKLTKSTQYAYGMRTRIKREYRLFEKVDDVLSGRDPPYRQIFDKAKEKGTEYAIAGAGRTNSTFNKVFFGFSGSNAARSMANSEGNCACR